MKVTYEWDSNKDDKHEKWLIDNASNMYAALAGISNQTREWIKYDSRVQIPSDEIREKVLALMYENDITPDDLT